MFNSSNIKMTADVEVVEKVKKERLDFKTTREETVAALTVEYQGMVFDANEESQNRIIRDPSVGSG